MAFRDHMAKLRGLANEKGYRLEKAALEGDLFVRSGPGTVKLSSESAAEYIRTRYGPVALGGP